MYEKNYSDINDAMNNILRPMLAGFVGTKLSAKFGNDNWWRLGVLKELYPDQKRFLPTDGTYAELTDKLDIQLSLLLIEIHWREIFSPILPYEYFNYVKELRTIRNTWAHKPESFDDAATMRALDTMAQISKEIDEETTEQLRAMWNEHIPKKNVVTVVEQSQENFLPIPENLKSWRDVIEPHPDVVQGRYRQAEFALNLAEIVRKKGRAEYTDPTEFFARTYLTGGLKNLLVATLKRLTDGDGEPVVRLQTSFGGGKSHSLLALYHLFGGKIRAEESSAVREVLNAAGVSFIPKVHTAVIVGTWENPLKTTLWGEIAAQLSKSTGKPELYEMIRANDEKGISPGAGLLKEIFDAAGASLILIDELVAYGRKLKIGEITEGGTVGNLITFIQELTEAAEASPKTAVVVSIPESEAEIVDANGRDILNQVDEVVGRKEFVWTSVTPQEGYEIVRRRLFRECRDTQAREEVCAAYFKMYLNNATDFPKRSQENKYRESLLSCYPIHPQLFEYLYEKWTSLEKFQKTRGALRLMSKVIYRLWTSNDKSLLIMPGTMPLDDAPVRDELTKLLGANWNEVVNTEVNGEHSKSCELDAQNLRYGRLSAARKISGAIFMGTAPGDPQNNVRGIDENEIHLGTIQPQEVEYISVYNDALTNLKTNLYYLHSQGSRLWFDTNATLLKMFDDERAKFSEEEIIYEIEQRLTKWKGRGQFKGVHICPKSSADVPDEKTARLVILSPKYIYNDRQKNNAAIDTAKEILDKRGTIPRTNKNMLMFLAAGTENFFVLRDAARDFMAWRAVKSKTNLDKMQLAEVESNLKSATDNFKMKVSQSYNKLIAPETYGEADLNLPLHVSEIVCMKEDNISVAFEKFSSDWMLVGTLGAEKLKSLLDKFIWRDRDHVELKQLWEYFTTYYYLPRLIDVNVLIDTVRRGVKAKTFALAEEFKDGKYINMHFGDVACGQIPMNYFLVKAGVAEKFIKVKPIEPKPPDKNDDDTPPPPPPPKPKLPKHFSMDVELDNARPDKSFKDCIDEVASRLMNLPSIDTSIRLVINISVPDGVPKDIKEDIEANCRDLKIENYHFEY